MEELLFDVIPRMLMIDRDQYPLIPETLTRLLRFLHETGRWGMGASTLGVIGQYELPDDAGAAAPPLIDTLLAASTHGEIRIPMPVDQPTRGAVDEAEMEDGAGGLLDTLSQLSDLTEVGVCAADVTPDEAGQLEWRITGGPALFAAALTACELGDLTPPDGI